MKTCNIYYASKNLPKTNHKDVYDTEVDPMTNVEWVHKKVMFSVPMGQAEAKNACIDLVTAEKLPLAVFLAKGFKH